MQCRWAASMFHLQTKTRFGNKNAMQHPNGAYSHCQIKGLGAGSSSHLGISSRDLKSVLQCIVLLSLSLLALLTSLLLF